MESYDVLVVATGLELDWKSIAGLDGNLGENGVVSIYDYNTLEETTRTIQNFTKGEAIFVMPPVKWSHFTGHSDNLTKYQGGQYGKEKGTQVLQ